eukprot:CAMPEP_0183338400 /NCGR_PEP_ID=MMETSP0164_2-20130417/5713_1 /TAXON_ID=221442 /ORGANISM="Coccolithus pelagicus ssp braarudi, Strain PLY182g" /LENGTH=36 /DNA_ID= /DNA_START= /DNA_END= /DNA_ORIENTATION=
MKCVPGWKKNLVITVGLLRSKENKDADVALQAEEAY